MKYVCFCKQCDFCGFIDKESDPICPKCNASLTLTSVTEDEWNEMAKEQREVMRNSMQTKSSTLPDIISDIRRDNSLSQLNKITTLLESIDKKLKLFYTLTLISLCSWGLIIIILIFCSIFNLL